MSRSFFPVRVLSRCLTLCAFSAWLTRLTWLTWFAGFLRRLLVGMGLFSRMAIGGVFCGAFFTRCALATFAAVTAIAVA
jgi:hypothetical protein